MNPPSPGEHAAELMIRIISDINPNSPARQFAETTKGCIYLRRLSDALPYRYSELERWLAETCHQCGWDAFRGDPAGLDNHIVMSTLVVVTCAGLPTVDPNEVGVFSPGWVDWTRSSSKANGNE